MNNREIVLLKHMLAACLDVEHEEKLLELVAQYPFQCVLAGEYGIAGWYLLGTGEIFLRSDLLLECTPDEALHIYLHETVHAGAWTQGRILRWHNEEFTDVIERVIKLFYLPETTESQKAYNLSQPNEVVKQLQSSEISLIGIVLCFIFAFYLLLNGFQQQCFLPFFVGAGVIALVETCRKAMVEKELNTRIE